MHVWFSRRFVLPFALAVVTFGGCSGPSSSHSSNPITTGAIQPANAGAGPRNQIPDTVVVGRSDTLSSIALRYQVSVAALMYVNDLKGVAIQTGQELHIPGPDVGK
jgi:LysM repeat protein